MSSFKDGLIAASASDQRGSILVVEDDQDTQDMLRTLLERHGYQVATADGGMEALSQLQQAHFDLVLSDVSMAHGDGLTLVAKVRELGLKDVPVILMSAQHDTKRRVSGLNLGADDFVPKPFDVEELLARLRAQLRRSDRQAELVRDSLLDPLTHVLNRRGFSELFASHSALLRRRPGTLSVLMIDLDGFKQVNDVHGHAAGDHVLVEVARMLTHTVRASDRVGRLGGDEFAILLPEANLEVAHTLATRVRALSPLAVEITPQLTLSVGLSIGAATEREDEPLDELLARADASMYSDKRSRATP